MLLCRVSKLEYRDSEIRTCEQRKTCGEKEREHQHDADANSIRPSGGLAIKKLVQYVYWHDQKREDHEDDYANHETLNAFTRVVYFAA